MFGRFPRDRPVRESRMPVNMRNQPHCDNGEGVDLHPLPYPLIQPAAYNVVLFGMLRNYIEQPQSAVLKRVIRKMRWKKATMKCFALVVLLLVVETTAWAADRPNMILVFIDDMGWGDFSCFGNQAPGRVAVP